MGGEPQTVDINLFAGAGGLALGLREAGFKPTLFVEVDKDAWATLQRNKLALDAPPGWEYHKGNAEAVDWSVIDKPVRLLAGGVPCQPFSLGGKHLAERDGRNQFPSFLRAVRQLRPQAVLVENVDGLVRDSFRPYFDYILRQLEYPSIEPRKGETWEEHNTRIIAHQRARGYEPEYCVKWAVLNAADFGVPQCRKRVFIIATACGLPPYTFPAATHSRQALLRSQDSGEYWDRHGLLRRKMEGKVPQVDDDRQPWVTVRDALHGLPKPALDEQSAEMNHWLIPGARMYRGHTGSRLDWPSKTIKAGVHGVPGGENTIVNDDGSVRYYTLREAARIQTFPDNHFFVGSRCAVTRQIGNAVPRRLAEVVASQLYTLLE